MQSKENKKIRGREELKKYFKNGEVPSENDFSYLIDSMVNKQDDGFYKDEEQGFVIAASGSSKRVITLYKNIDDLYPFYFVEVENQEDPALKLKANTNSDDQSENENASFFFHTDGRLGIGKKSDQQYTLDINGYAGMQGRIGTYKTGTIPADGKWHSVIDGLDNCNGFEIVARTGKKGAGRFALLHAIALSAFGRSKSKIRKTCAYYGFFWNKLNVRWKGSTHNYALQLRSNSNYGKGINIFYTITRLWEDELFLSEDDYYPKTQGYT